MKVSASPKQPPLRSGFSGRSLGNCGMTRGCLVDLCVGVSVISIANTAGSTGRVQIPPRPRCCGGNTLEIRMAAHSPPVSSSPPHANELTDSNYKPHGRASTMGFDSTLKPEQQSFERGRREPRHLHSSTHLPRCPGFAGELGPSGDLRAWEQGQEVSGA